MASKVDKRRREIISLLQADGTIYVKELAALFKVTRETIRSDFDWLADQHGYNRIHGGIEMTREGCSDNHYLYQDHTGVNIENKRQISYRAMDLIKDGDCIYVDSGSTVSYILNYINRCRDLTLVTPSLALLMKYQMDGYDQVFKEGGHHLIFVGGNVDSRIMTTYGPFFDEMVETFVFDAVLFSADGVDMERGVTNRDEVAYSVIKRVEKHAKQCLLLVDHSKFDVVNLYKTVDYSRVDYLVTDKDLDQGWQTFLEEQKVTYYKA